MDDVNPPCESQQDHHRAQTFNTPLEAGLRSLFILVAPADARWISSG